MSGEPPGRPLRFILDQGLPREAAIILRAAGVDCVHAGELGMAAAQDSEILGWARLNAAVVVTLDADFHAELAVTGAALPSVIRIRLEGLAGAALAAGIE